MYYGGSDARGTSLEDVHVLDTAPFFPPATAATGGRPASPQPADEKPKKGSPSKGKDKKSKDADKKPNKKDDAAAAPGPMVWSRLAPAGVPPSPRALAVVAASVAGPGAWALLVFGGIGADDATLFALRVPRADAAAAAADARPTSSKGKKGKAAAKDEAASDASAAASSGGDSAELVDCRAGGLRWDRARWDAVECAGAPPPLSLRGAAVAASAEPTAEGVFVFGGVAQVPEGPSAPDGVKGACHWLDLSRLAAADASEASDDLPYGAAAVLAAALAPEAVPLEPPRLGWARDALTEDDVYEGQMKKGLRHGHGRMAYGNGDVYEGGWAKGVRSGQGSLALVTGRGGTYDGAWAGGKVRV